VPGFVNEFDLFQANSLVVASDSLKLSVSEFSQTYRSYFNNNQKGGPASTEIDITIYGRSSCDAPLEAMETYNGKINWTNSQPNGPGCGGGSYVGSAEL